MNRKNILVLLLSLINYILAFIFIPDFFSKWSLYFWGIYFVILLIINFSLYVKFINTTHFIRKLIIFNIFFNLVITLMFFIYTINYLNWILKSEG
jgi:hypothetical protein